MNVHLSHSEDETAALGRELGAGLSVGDVVLLTGPLGAGKTAFTRGLAGGLGCDVDDVSSPTFAIIQAYAGRIPVQHVDLYRLTPIEVDDLALDELGEGGVTVVEWPERWSSPPSPAWRVTFEHVSDNERRIVIVAPDDQV